MVYVALTPLNTRWFVVKRKGHSYKVEKAPFPPVPFDPLELICSIELLLESCANWEDNEKGLRPEYDNYLEIECPAKDNGTHPTTLFNTKEDYRLTITIQTIP